MSCLVFVRQTGKIGAATQDVSAAESGLQKQPDLVGAKRIVDRLHNRPVVSSAFRFAGT